MPEPWPEGKYADPQKARERYEAGLGVDREARAELFRFDTGEAHGGLAVVLVAAVVVGCFGSPAAAALWVGGPAAVVHLLASIRAWRPACVAARCWPGPTGRPSDGCPWASDPRPGGRAVSGPWQAETR